MYTDFLSKILENIWCNIQIRICYSSQGPGRLLFPLYILTKEDLILRTLTNNFWLFDKNFLGMWKVTEKKTAANSYFTSLKSVLLIYENCIQKDFSFFFFLTSNLYMECDCAFCMKFMWSTICWIEYEFEAYLLSKWTASIKAEEILHKMTEVLCISCQDWSDIRWRHIFRSVSWSITWSLPWPVGTP